MTAREIIMFIAAIIATIILTISVVLILTNQTGNNVTDEPNYTHIDLTGLNSYNDIYQFGMAKTHYHLNIYDSLGEIKALICFDTLRPLNGFNTDMYQRRSILGYDGDTKAATVGMEWKMIEDN